MKVLFVSSSRKGKGISPFIKSQAESLIKNGIQVDFYQIEGSGLFNYIKSINKINQKIKTEHFDLIHAHYGFSGIVAKFASYKLPVIVSFLGDDLIGNVMTCGKYSRFSKFLVLVNKIFAKYFFDANIVKSEYLGSKLFKNTKYHVIPNGVDLDRFFPVSQEIARNHLNLDQEGKYILFLGNPARPVKNYTLFEKSLDHIKSSSSYQVLILNDIQNNQLNDYYNAANICVLSSVHEGSPNVIKEAMACNAVIVSTPVGDVNWLFGNLEGCFISNPDPVSFSKALDKAIEFDAKSLKPSGRDRIKSLYLDNESIAAKILTLYIANYKNKD